MSPTLKYVLLIALVLLLAAIPLAMQRDTGRIDGVITDEHGPIAKVSVEARNTMSGDVFRGESDAAGHYKLASLPQGRYSLWVKAPEHDSQWIRRADCGTRPDDSSRYPPGNIRYPSASVRSG